jgi:hypothetical protein
MDRHDDPGPSESSVHRRAARVLVAFVLTFMAARITVFLILSRRIPDIYLHIGGTHVHHLNLGIFLLSGVGAYLLFAQPGERALQWASTAFGIGLALTFDEFGMWVHLGGSYWQRASFDAVVVLASFLGLLATAPRLLQFRPQHRITAGILVMVTLIFIAMLGESFRYAHRILYRIEILDDQRPLP